MVERICADCGRKRGHGYYKTPYCKHCNSKHTAAERGLKLRGRRPVPEGYLSVIQVAERRFYARTSISMKIKKGQIKATCIGSRTLIAEADYQAAIVAGVL